MSALTRSNQRFRLATVFGKPSAVEGLVAATHRPRVAEGASNGCNDLSAPAGQTSRRRARRGDHRGRSRGAQRCGVHRDPAGVLWILSHLLSRSTAEARTAVRVYWTIRPADAPPADRDLARTSTCRRARARGGQQRHGTSAAPGTPTAPSWNHRPSRLRCTPLKCRPTEAIPASLSLYLAYETLSAGMREALRPAGRSAQRSGCLRSGSRRQ